MCLYSLNFLHCTCRLAAWLCRNDTILEMTDMNGSVLVSVGTVGLVVAGGTTPAAGSVGSGSKLHQACQGARGARDALVQAVEDGQEVVRVDSHDAGVELRGDALQLVKVSQLGAQGLGKLDQALLLVHQPLAAFVQRPRLGAHVPVLCLERVEAPQRAVHLAEPHAPSSGAGDKQNISCGPLSQRLFAPYVQCVQQICVRPRN